MVLDHPKELTPIYFLIGMPTSETKQQHKTAKNKQRQREEDKAAKAHALKAHKSAMTWYAAEKEKFNGMEAANILNLAKEAFDGVGPSERTIQKYYKDGRVGTYFTIEAGLQVRHCRSYIQNISHRTRLFCEDQQ